MKSKIMYLENKSNGHNGLAWIGFVEFSKSGQTVYFDNKALKKLKISGISGNYFNIETGEEYWVSGVKKNGQDRHPLGSGKIMPDKNSIEEYLKLVDFKTISEQKYTITEFIQTDKTRFNTKENTEIELRDESRQATFYDNNRRKLINSY
ncbi:mannose-1-phosphate guanylyltransferase [Chryseobacterium sp. SIMBA_029]|uniref:mannose-1-phosphate guanylyltransferase n=1 Tax=Chryseobacterium sp. SIMBA_029 TaxID=3085772 RepID=UPI00397E61F6